MSYQLEVHTPNKEIFDAYYYGYGKLISQEAINRDGQTVVCSTVDYGDDGYRAEYQAGRFWSGLYPAEVKEVKDVGG